MIYLSKFVFASIGQEENFRFQILGTCHDSWYPFGILSKHQFRQIDFEPITILYGGNGSGKSTALNIISEKLKLDRDTLYNRSNFYENYLEYCNYETEAIIPQNSRIITNDDVFDFMLNLRCINNGIDQKREEGLEDYLNLKSSKFKMRSLADYEKLKKITLARSKTQSQYIRNTVMDNVREHSNGERAFLYYAEKIKENALYLLDEAPVCVKKWTELENVREYYDFFLKHDKEFEK